MPSRATIVQALIVQALILQALIAHALMFHALMFHALISEVGRHCRLADAWSPLVATWSQATSSSTSSCRGRCTATASGPRCRRWSSAVQRCGCLPTAMPADWIRGLFHRGPACSSARVFRRICGKEARGDRGMPVPHDARHRIPCMLRRRAPFPAPSPSPTPGLHRAASSRCTFRIGSSTSSLACCSVRFHRSMPSDRRRP